MDLESVFPTSLPASLHLLVLAFASDRPPQPLFSELCGEGQLLAARRLVGLLLASRASAAVRPKVAVNRIATAR